MPVAVAVVGTSIAGAYYSNKQAGKAASAQRAGLAATDVAAGKALEAQQEAGALASDRIREFFDISMGATAPWRETGESALAQYYDELGQPADYGAGFKESEGYKFQLEQGLQAAERSMAARGLTGSGRAAKELTRYGQGLAATEFQSYWNRQRTQREDYLGRLSGLAGWGAQAASQAFAGAAGAGGQLADIELGLGRAEAQRYGVTGEVARGQADITSQRAAERSQMVGGLLQTGTELFGQFGSKPTTSVGDTSTPTMAVQEGLSMVA